MRYSQYARTKTLVEPPEPLVLGDVSKCSKDRCSIWINISFRWIGMDQHSSPDDAERVGDQSGEDACSNGRAKLLAHSNLTVLPEMRLDGPIPCEKDGFSK